MTRVFEYPVPEAVDFDNLGALRKRAEQEIDGLADGQSMLVKFASASLNGSAAVALMIAMYRRAHVAGKSINFVDVPDEVVNIIEVSGLSDVFSLAPASSATDETVSGQLQN